MIKYSKFTDNIGSGNFNNKICQKTNKFQKEAVPTIFCFGPEIAKKQRESSIRCAEKSVKKFWVVKAISSHGSYSSHVYNKDILGLKFTS